MMKSVTSPPRMQVKKGSGFVEEQLSKHLSQTAIHGIQGISLKFYTAKFLWINEGEWASEIGFL